MTNQPADFTSILSGYEVSLIKPVDVNIRMKIIVRIGIAGDKNAHQYLFLSDTFMPNVTNIGIIAKTITSK